MKKVILVSLMLILGSSISAQCICGKLRFAIDGNEAYSYRFGIGEKIEYSVSFISSADQVHRSVLDPAETFTIHESYGIYDKKSGKSQTVTFDERKHLSVSIDPYEKIIVEVTNDKKEKMVIRFTKRGVDSTYNILTDFSAGEFSVNLTAMRLELNRAGKEKKLFYNDSEISRLSSNLGENYWNKIKDIEKFRN